MRAIYGKKIGMTRIFDDKGKQIPVTLIEAKDNVVFQVKGEKDNKIVSLASGNKKRLNKPQKGQFDKLNIKPEKVTEFKTGKDLKVGDKITLSEFNEGEVINITGVSKGKGFAGTVKRHNFNTGPKTHGSNNYRQPGSIGATGPQRVVKGKKMAGHMGDRKTTIPSSTIIKIIPEKSLMLIRGAVPGPKNSWSLLWTKNES
ncbi:MAG: rplC [Candidatus Berkelbacteria bacterium]|nr:rplC [Candidatus Berkelbacteria bacterium]